MWAFTTAFFLFILLMPAIVSIFERGG